MRISAGVVVVMGVLASGCGLINSSSMPPTGDPLMLTPGTSVPDQSQIFDDSLAVDQSDTPPPKATQYGGKSIKHLSPKWAKEEAPVEDVRGRGMEQTDPM